MSARTCCFGLEPEAGEDVGLDLLELEHPVVEVGKAVGQVHDRDDLAVLLVGLQRLVVAADRGDQLLREVPLLGDQRADLGVVESDGEVLQQLGGDLLLLAEPLDALQQVGVQGVATIWPRSCRMPPTYTSSRISLRLRKLLARW